MHLIDTVSMVYIYTRRGYFRQLAAADAREPDAQQRRRVRGTARGGGGGVEKVVKNV